MIAKHLIFYHLIPYPEGLVAKMLFFDGVNEIYKNWTIGRDGVMGIVPVEKDELPIKLPLDVDLKKKGGNPLSDHPSWKKTIYKLPLLD